MTDHAPARNASPQSPAVKLCFTIPETATAIGVSPRQVYNLARDLGLPTIKLGGRRLVRLRDLEKWLAAQPIAALTSPAAVAEGGTS